MSNGHWIGVPSARRPSFGSGPSRTGSFVATRTASPSSQERFTLRVPRHYVRIYFISPLLRAALAGRSGTGRTLQ